MIHSFNGRILVIEGGDRSGKGLQTDVTYKKLDDMGYDIVKSEFPNYDTTTGKVLHDFLHGKFGDSRKVPAEAASLYFAANRVEEREKLWDWLSQGKLVILNRYRESNEAFNGAKLPENQRGDFIRNLRYLEGTLLGLPDSDMVIYLDVPRKFSKMLEEKENKTSGKISDQYEKDDAYQEEVANTYRKLANDSINWHVVDCIKDGDLMKPEEINEKMMGLIREKGLLDSIRRKC